jgi:membrane dipeptidase
MLEDSMISRRRFLQTLPVASATAVGFSSRRAWSAPFAGSLDTGNEVIQKARQAALRLLQPSEKEVQRGLELHAQSIVFDAYGFAPRAALDGAAVAAAIAAGASHQELTDLREEQMMTRFATDERERAEFFEAMRAAGVTCLFQNAGEEGNDPLRLIKRLSRFVFATDRLRDVLPKAIGPDDVAAAKNAGRLAMALTTNGVPLPQRWESTRDETSLIRLFRQLGVRMMHLTYNRRNPLGDGCGEPNDGGVSDFGKAAIAEMNRQGVIVDVAHSGWRTSREAALASERPIVASHTTCGGLYEHFRGKPDDTLRAICDRGGLFGICCIPRFLGGNGDIRDFLNHLDYGIKKFGADHVAIGTDTAYQSRNAAAENAKIPKRQGPPERGTAARWEHLWPKDDFKPASEAAESLAWTNWPLFTVGLVQRGHSDEVIKKVIGENVLRVWRANETLG